MFACETCGFGMDDAGGGRHWCKRCGTYRNVLGNVFVPMLVEQCRKFEAELNLDENCPNMPEEWFKMGIDESIRTPEQRK